MLQTAFAVFVALATVIAGMNWRYGILLTYVIGLAQDPVRKAIVNRPAYLVLAVVPVMIATMVGALARQRRPWQVYQDYPALLHVLIPMVLVVMIGALVTLASFGPAAAVLIPLGAANYLAPFVVLAFGYQAVRHPDDFRGLFVFAAVLSAISLVGVAFEYKGYDWSVLGTLNRKEWIHHFGYGKYVAMICGFQRSPESMGWHGALVAMVAILMLTTSRSFASVPFWLGMGSWGLTCAMLSGRRKMLFMVLSFAVALAVFYVLARRTGRTAGLIATIVVLLGGTGALSIWLDVNDRYVELAATTLPSAPKRVETSSYGSMTYTLQQAGFLGYGLGTLSQGVQHLKVKGPDNAWQEGAPNKIMAELGLPGIITVAIAALVLSLCCIDAARISVRNPQLMPWGLGLLAMLFANGVSYGAAQQLYGDPFILCLNGLMLGMLLSIRRLSNTGRRPPASRILAWRAAAVSVPKPLLEQPV